MRAGRRRWAIENETFNTLKAQNGYNFEHDYGHGKNYLADVFPTLAMLAFLIDQVQLLCCGRFQKARDYKKRKSISGKGYAVCCRISVFGTGGPSISPCPKKLPSPNW